MVSVRLGLGLVRISVRVVKISSKTFLQKSGTRKKEIATRWRVCNIYYKGFLDGNCICRSLRIFLTKTVAIFLKYVCS